MAAENGVKTLGERLSGLGRELRLGKAGNNTGSKNGLRLKAGLALALAFLFAGPLVSDVRAQLYAVDSSRALYVIDINTGAKTLIGTVSANAGTTAGLCYDPVSQTVYLTSTGNDSLYTLDLATGTATLVGAYGDSAIVMHGLEFNSATGILYGVSSHNNGLYTINPLTGLASLVGTSGLTSFTNLGFNSISNQMFATNSGTDSFYSMNLATGGATLIGALGGPTNPHGLAFNPDNGMLYLVDSSTDSLYTINLATGATTLIGSTGSGNLLGLLYIPIPEPGSVILLGLGAALFAARRWRAVRSKT